MNSAPTCGARAVPTRDDSTNNWWVALLTFGEGWHTITTRTPHRRAMAWRGTSSTSTGSASAPDALGLAWDVKLAKIAERPCARANETSSSPTKKPWRKIAGVTRRQKAIAFFVVLCVILVTAAVSLNIGGSSSKRGGSAAPHRHHILRAHHCGLIVYTVFLVLEIKRNEDHDSFSTPSPRTENAIASCRLYLQTLQSREVDEARRASSTT